MVTWIIFKNHLLEIGLTQNHEIMVLWTLTAVDLFYFHHGRGPAWIKIHWNSIWLRARSHMTSRYTWGPWPHYMMLEVCWNGLWTLSFGLSQFHGHGSRLVCEVALTWSSPKLAPCSHYHNLLLPNGLISSHHNVLIHSYWSVSSMSVMANVVVQ